MSLLFGRKRRVTTIPSATGLTWGRPEWRGCGTRRRTDRPGALEIRKENREAHLAHIRDSGVVAQAGPFLDDEGAMCGSLVILEVASRAEAEAWAEADPYARAGLFESVSIRAWNKVL